MNCTRIRSWKTQEKDRREAKTRKEVVKRFNRTQMELKRHSKRQGSELQEDKVMENARKGTEGKRKQGRMW